FLGFKTTTSAHGQHCALYRNNTARETFSIDFWQRDRIKHFKSVIQLISSAYRFQYTVNDHDIKRPHLTDVMQTDGLETVQRFFIAACRHQYDREVTVHVNLDRKSTRLNSSHVSISYAVFCLKKKIISYNPSKLRQFI